MGIETYSRVQAGARIGLSATDAWRRTAAGGTQLYHCQGILASLNPNGTWATLGLIKAMPAKYLGQVFATNEAEVIKEAAKEFNVAEALRDRIVARREDY